MLNKLQRSLGVMAVAGALVVGGLVGGEALAQAPTPVPQVVQDADVTHGDDVHAADQPADVEHDAPGAVVENAHEADAHATSDDHAAADDHGEAHGESLWVTLARVANFALLAGGLFYFLRGPVSQHLASRGAQIRGDLQAAAQMKVDATARLAEIEQRLAGLPAELEMVKQRGAEEVAAEEARITDQARIERDRLVAQSRREIEQQVRTARQALKAQAAALAVGVAETRLRETLTPAEQQRLADAFSSHVGGRQ
jgi:F-type H+-transporting ATPase subunit b